jgi:hypothetical protein
VKDLASRGLLDSTIVMWAGEFGRLPTTQNGDGRDHNRNAFTIWFAGGGFRKGLIYGETDDFGYKSVVNRVSVPDMIATVLQQLGLDHQQVRYPYGGRVEVEGPSLMLTASPAQSFALALHELATNAAKYGALSNATGRVHINWSKLTSNGSDRLFFRWQELGGPPVRPPTRKGFGSVVLEEAMTEHFDVPPRIEFSIAGVTYELIGPLEALTGNDMVQKGREAGLS